MRLSRVSYLLLLAPAIGHAEEGVSAAVEGAPRTMPTAAAPAPRTEQPAYRLPLALAYLVPISVVTVGAFALSSPGYYVSGIAGAAGMIAAPPLVHSAHDNGSAAAGAVLGTLASISGGALLGAGILIVSGYQPKGADDGVGQVGGAAILGGALGAGVGYVAWGTFDVLENARAHGPAPSHGDSASTIRSTIPSLQPIFAADRDGTVGMAGVQVELGGEF